MNMIVLLMKHHADPNIPNLDKETPMQEAEAKNRVDIIEVLRGTSSLLQNSEESLAEDSPKSRVEDVENVNEIKIPEQSSPTDPYSRYKNPGEVLRNLGRKSFEEAPEHLDYSMLRRFQNSEKFKPKVKEVKSKRLTPAERQKKKWTIVKAGDEQKRLQEERAKKNQEDQIDTESLLEEAEQAALKEQEENRAKGQKKRKGNAQAKQTPPPKEKESPKEETKEKEEPIKEKEEPIKEKEQPIKKKEEPIKEKEEPKKKEEPIKKKEEPIKKKEEPIKKKEEPIKKKEEPIKKEEKPAPKQKKEEPNQAQKQQAKKPQTQNRGKKIKKDLKIVQSSSSSSDDNDDDDDNVDEIIAKPSFTNKEPPKSQPSQASSATQVQPQVQPQAQPQSQPSQTPQEPSIPLDQFKKLMEGYLSERQNQPSQQQPIQQQPIQYTLPPGAYVVPAPGMMPQIAIPAMPQMAPYAQIPPFLGVGGVPMNMAVQSVQPVQQVRPAPSMAVSSLEMQQLEARVASLEQMMAPAMRQFYGQNINSANLGTCQNCNTLNAASVCPKCGTRLCNGCRNIHSNQRCK